MLSKRLCALASLVPSDSILADIGTDHALLPIYLVKSKLIQKAYACDIHEGPLNSARHNIIASGVSNEVIPILSDGLNQVPIDVDVILIAGMGWDTAHSILENGKEHLYLSKKVIVQINKDYSKLRKWIANHSFTILEERVVKEKNKYYLIIVFNTSKKDQYCLQELYINKDYQLNQSEEWLEYLRFRLKQLEIIRQHSNLLETEYITINNYLLEKKCK